MLHKIPTSLTPPGHYTQKEAKIPANMHRDHEPVLTSPPWSSCRCANGILYSTTEKVIPIRDICHLLLVAVRRVSAYVVRDSAEQLPRVLFVGYSSGMR